MARLRVGLPSLQGKLKNYADKFGMVELTPVDTPLPKASKLRAWRKQVPPSFAFSIVLPKAVACLEPGKAYDQALATALAAATALEASCILLASPSSVRPTSRARDRILELAAALPQTGHHLMWSAAGMWEPGDVAATAARAGLLPVVDAVQETLPRGPVVYTRIRALGTASRIGADRIRQIAEQLVGRRECFVVADPQIIGPLRSGLPRALDLLEANNRNGSRPTPALFRPGLPPQLVADDEEQ